MIASEIGSSSSLSLAGDLVLVLVERGDADALVLERAHEHGCGALAVQRALDRLEDGVVDPLDARTSASTLGVLRDRQRPVDVDAETDASALLLHRRDVPRPIGPADRQDHVGALVGEALGTSSASSMLSKSPVKRPSWSTGSQPMTCDVRALLLVVVVDARDEAVHEVGHRAGRC